MKQLKNEAIISSVSDDNTTSGITTKPKRKSPVQQPKNGQGKSVKAVERVIGSDLALKDRVFACVERDRVSNVGLAKWFPNYVGEYKRLLSLMEYLFVEPYRNMHTIADVICAGRNYVRKAMAYLCDLGYCVSVKRPRLIIVFKAYVMCDVYMTTNVGKRVIKEIYEEFGLL